MLSGISPVSFRREFENLNLFRLMLVAERYDRGKIIHHLLIPKVLVGLLSLWGTPVRNGYAPRHCAWGTYTVIKAPPSKVRVAVRVFNVIGHLLLAGQKRGYGKSVPGLHGFHLGR
jgi:hypothetical protein